MQNAKKFLVIGLSVLLALSISACSSTPSGSESSQPEASQSQPEPAAAQPTQEKITETSYDFGHGFRNGYALVAEGWKIGYINTEGKFFPAYDLTDCPDDVKDTVNAVLSDGQLFVSEEGLFPLYDVESGKWGYGNITTGETVVEPRYVHCGPFASGCAVGEVDEGHFEVINAKGEILATPAKVFDGYYQKDRLIVSMTGRTTGFQNTAGTGYEGALLDPQGNTILDGCFLVQKEDGVVWRYVTELDEGTGTPVLENVRGLKGRFLLQNDGTLWEMTESPDRADGYELRRLAENVSSVEWMSGWNCLLYTDQDGVLWTTESDGSPKEIAERIWVPT